MEQEPHGESQDQPESSAEQPAPPPFDPDPRLVTYLERGSRRDAERRFRTETKGRDVRRPK
jgi:hypothetical protein